MPTTVFPIIPSRTGVLFFDAQNIYLHPLDAEPHSRSEIASVLLAMEKIYGACRAAGIAVFYSQGDHRPDGKDFVPTIVDRDYYGRRGEPPRTAKRPRVTAGAPEASIVPELAPQPEDYIVKKHRWSAFYQTHLELSLRAAGIDTLLLAGGSTEVGVASTAYSARDRDLSLVILRDACRSHGPGVNDFLMDHVFPIFARVMTTDEVISAIDGQ